jgi:hypothetical protein
MTWSLFWAAVCPFAICCHRAAVVWFRREALRSMEPAQIVNKRSQVSHPLV